MTTIASDTTNNQNVVDEFGWEKTKENFKPRAKGRDVKKLNALSDNASHLTALKEKQKMQRDAFENAVATYEGDHPIKPWLKYIKWAETEFPSSSAVAMPLYERCTRAFFQNEQYRNNVKYLTVWLKYADELDDSSEVFRFLYANKIGEERSFFYIAWALVEEEKKRYPLADKIYARGLALGAKPEDVLETRHTQFKRRMSRHWLKQADEYMGRDVTEDNNQNSNGREAFSMLNSASAAGSRREGTGGRIDENTGRRTGPKTGGGLQASSTFKQNSQVSTLGNFQIFVEEGFRTEDVRSGNNGQMMMDKGDDLLQESASVPWDEFGTVEQRKKENVKTVTAWNEGGLYDGSNKSLSDSSIHVGSRNRAPKVPAAKPNAFAICIDEEFNDADEANHMDDGPGIQPSAKKISLRRRIEGSTKRSKEEQEVLDLKANPFKNYDATVNVKMPNVEKLLVSDPIPPKKANSEKSSNVKKKNSKKLSNSRKKGKKHIESSINGSKKLGKSRLRRKKSSSSNVTYGFKENLLKDSNDIETCFEEQRGIKWLAKKKEKDLIRIKQKEEEAAAAKERKKALATLQTSADDIVTEMRRKPLAARNNARRATLCTITPNLQTLYGDNNNNDSSGIWSSEKKGEAETIDVVDKFERQHALNKSTARKILKFDDTSSARNSVATKQLFFSTGVKKSEKSPVNTSMKKDTTTRKVLNFNSFANESVDVVTNNNNHSSVFQSVIKQNTNNHKKSSPKTATRRLFFTGGDDKNESVALDVQNDDKDNMTINMKEALDDVGGLFDDNDNSPINNRAETSTAMASIRFIEGKSLLSETKTINNNFKVAIDASDDDTFGDEINSPGTMARDDMTLNMKAAMQDLGDLFCSPEGVLKEYINISNHQEKDTDDYNDNNNNNSVEAMQSQNKNDNTSKALGFQIFQDETGDLHKYSDNNDNNVDIQNDNNTADLLMGIVDAADTKNEPVKDAFQFSIFEDNGDNNENDNKNGSSVIQEPLFEQQDQHQKNIVNNDNQFVIFDENHTANVNTNEPEVDLYRENQENETPPRGLSSRGRRFRMLEQLQSEDLILGEIVLEAVDEEEDEEEEDIDGNENIENQNEQEVDIPSIRRVTARARSPLQITQESVSVNDNATDVLDVVGLGHRGETANENGFAVAPPITRDLSDPKYDFEIFEDNNESSNDDLVDDEEAEFGLIDEFGNLG